MKKISIIYILPDLEMGGAERIVTTIANHLPREKFVPKIMLLRKEGAYLDFLKDDVENFNVETTCEIHSLIKNGKEYLKIECRNKAENKDSEKVYLLLFAVTLMTSIVYSFSKKPKIFDDVDPRVPIWIIIIILFLVLH